jgi:hypothetical protein
MYASWAMFSAAAQSFVQASEKRKTSSQCASNARSYSKSADPATIELALIPTYTEKGPVSRGRDCGFAQGDPPSTRAVLATVPGRRFCAAGLHPGRRLRAAGPASRGPPDRASGRTCPRWELGQADPGRSVYEPVTRHALSVSHTRRPSDSLHAPSLGCDLAPNYHSGQVRPDGKAGAGLLGPGPVSGAAAGNRLARRQATGWRVGAARQRSAALGTSRPAPTGPRRSAWRGRASSRRS